MAINNVRHPIKDTVKADNSTYSSNKIESLIHSATELPETSIADAGDVLMVNDEGEWDKGEIIIPQEVPTPTVANIGKVVSVVSDGDDGAEYGLENIPNEVPTPAVGDIGKVISVVSDGDSGAEYGLGALPESGILNFMSVGVIVTDANFNAVFAIKPVDVKNALDAGKDVRLIAKIVNDSSFTKDSKRVYLFEDDLIVFKFMGKVQNGSGLDYSFRSVTPYYHPASTPGTDLKGDLIINFTNKLTSTSVGFQTNASYDVSNLETTS